MARFMFRYAMRMAQRLDGPPRSRSIARKGTHTHSTMRSAGHQLASKKCPSVQLDMPSPPRMIAPKTSTASTSGHAGSGLRTF